MAICRYILAIDHDFMYSVFIVMRKEDHFIW